jgi:hypothetical protein
LECRILLGGRHSRVADDIGHAVSLFMITRFERQIPSVRHPAAGMGAICTVEPLEQEA